MAAMLERVSRAVRPNVLRTMFATALLTVATYAVATELRGDHPDSYVVKRGDTLWDISRKFEGLTIEKLKSLNNLSSNKLQPGQKLIVAQ